MKRIILLELCLLFLATTFQGDNPPPGWYIQPIPVNKNITDIHFTDTLHGWAVTALETSNDTGYILKTTNGGMNWLVNFSIYHTNFSSIQFVDINTGYSSGFDGYGFLYKTTNSGLNWSRILHTGLNFSDLYFINKDTGWVCDDDNLVGIGLIKTTNGGNNWVQQLSPGYAPSKMFFLNRDTGWITGGGKFWRTNNSGNNWVQTYNFGATTIYNIFFTTSDTGWIIKSGGILKTINGGYNWAEQQDPYPQGSAPYNIYMISSTYGYVTTAYFKVLKTTNGEIWKQQNAPEGSYSNIYFTDSLNGWTNHGYLGNKDIAATQDGGGPVVGINNINTEIPKEYELGQNYPNPFNPISKIKYKISRLGGSSTVNVQIIVFDITGKEIAVLINEKKSQGEYYATFNGNSLSSGIYFYSLFADGKKIDTKRMMLLK